MKTHELRSMNDDQLADTLRETSRQLFQLRFQGATERLDTPSELRAVRKRIARIKTIQRERELQKETPTTPAGA